MTYVHGCPDCGMPARWEAMRLVIHHRKGCQMVGAPDTIDGNEVVHEIERRRFAQ